MAAIGAFHLFPVIAAACYTLRRDGQLFTAKVGSPAKTA
jgi:hypothetical protein